MSFNYNPITSLACWLYLLMVSTVVAFGSVGVAFIELKAPPGLSVYLDENYIGLTNADHSGMYIETAPGDHRISVHKSSYKAQVFSVSLANNQVMALEVETFEPEIVISESGASNTSNIIRDTGKLVLQTLPLQCRILVPELGIDYNKIQDRWTADNVPTGTYKGIVETGTQSYPVVLTVKSNRTTHLFVNVIKGDVRELYSNPLESLSLQVTTGPKVLISWTPGYNAQAWIVESTESGQDMWMGGISGSSYLTPPIEYGIVPDGAISGFPAESLIVGQKYRVSLVGPLDEQFNPINDEPLGSVEFTR